MKPQRRLLTLAGVTSLRNTLRICLLVAACTGALAWLGAVGGEAGTITLSAIDRGEYTEQGYHNGGTGGVLDGYTTGRINPWDYTSPDGDEYRAFHVFDVPNEVNPLSYRTVTGAELRLFNPGGGVGGSSGWFTTTAVTSTPLYATHVGTDIGSLRASHYGDGVGIFNDLGGGSYGSTNVGPFSDNTTVGISLGGSASSDIRNKAGSQFAVGTTLGGLVPRGQGAEYIFGNAINQYGSSQLVLYTADANLDAGSSQNFGDVLVKGSRSRNITVRNSGDSGSTLRGYIGSSGDSEIQPTSSTLPFTLGAGASRSRTFTYRPTERGSDSTSVFIDSNRYDTTRSLYGTGVAPLSYLSETGNNAGSTLVGTTKTASVLFRNTGDGNRAGTGTTYNLNGNVQTSSGEFSLSGSSSMSLADNTSKSFTYFYAPTARGGDAASLYGSFSNGSTDGRNNSHSRGYHLYGTGVAPVRSFGVANAGNVRIGTSGTASVTVNNVGDGNDSGVAGSGVSGAPGGGSNLNGSLAGSSGTFVGAGGSLSLPDDGSRKFDYAFTPIGHGLKQEMVTLSLANGSANGTNSAEVLNLQLSATGVGPEFASSVAPGSTLGFGEVPIDSFFDVFFDISNDTPDAELGVLTTLTLLSASFSGPDADRFSLVGFTPGTGLAKSEDETIQVRFDPGTDPIGPKSATLTITTDQGAAFGSVGDAFDFNLSATSVPAPSSLVGLVSMGLFGAVAWAWRRRRRVGP